MTNIFPQRTVIVEIMPMCLIETHKAANNFGKYPMNGSFRELVLEADAENIIKEYPEYNHIVPNSLRTLWRCRNGYVIKNEKFIIWVDYSIGAFSATEIKSNNRKSNLGTKKLPTIETSEELQILQLHNILDDLERNYENIIH